MHLMVNLLSGNMPHANLLSSFIKEIDELLATNLSQEDEDAVLNELEEITKVGRLLLDLVENVCGHNMWLKLF